MDFNPRSREGSDERQLSGMPFLLHFNPRSREGSDLTRAQAGEIKIISIRAPAKGATYGIVSYKYQNM